MFPGQHRLHLQRDAGYRLVCLLDRAGQQERDPEAQRARHQDIHQPDRCGTRQSMGPAGDPNRTLRLVHKRREDIGKQGSRDKEEHDRRQPVDHPERQRQRSKRQDDLQGDPQVGWWTGGARHSSADPC